MQPALENLQTHDDLGLNLALAFQGGTDCVLVVNERQRILSCSPDAEKLLRLPPGQSKRSVLPLPLQKLVRQATSLQSPVRQRITLFGRSRNPLGLHVNAIPIEVAPKKRATVILLRDMGAGRKLEKSVRQLDRLASLGVLSAAVTHEIKNALVSVKTFVDLLLEKDPDAELAEVVRREMRRIEALVAQTLKHAGPARPSLSLVHIHDVLEHSLRMVRPRLESSLISLNRCFNAAPDNVQGDDYQLEQAFVNLLFNAVESMGTNGSLTVSTDLVSAVAGEPRAEGRGGARLRIAIADTGVGISTENLSRLFEPFFTTKQQGTGLGLAIARRIVQEHHGEITVESQVDKGTTFKILLPVHTSVNAP